MPPGKRRQSNAMLYTLITFVGLFIVATTVAVIYYVKAEELRTSEQDAQNELSAMASAEEVRTVGALVGTKLPGESNLGTLLQHFDRMTGLVLGPVQVTSAEVKVNSAMDTVKTLMTQVEPYVTLPASDPNAAGPDPNGVALASMMGDLLANLKQTIDQSEATAQQLATLQQRFDDATALWQQTEQDLTAKVDEYRQQVEQTRSDYSSLKTALEQSSEQRAANLLKQLEDERARARQCNNNLLKTQAELQVAQARLGDALAEVGKIRPAPDRDAVAYAADGDVILVDDSAGIIHINLGSDDRVYRGLTFSVYDKGAGIPKDGQPKAEVEIFAVAKKTSVARVLTAKKRNPIATDDIVANLIWDRDKANEFVIAGEFDLNRDERPDYSAHTDIQSLIEKWGGAVSDSVSAKTDFVIVGTEPFVPQEPTFEDLAEDPGARERYDAAQSRLARYNQIRQQAQALYIPVFTYDRFLHFTGYESQINQPGAF